MAVRRPRPQYLSVRSRRTSDPLVAVREDPVETVAESDMMGGFQLNVYLQARPGRRTDGRLTELFVISGYCLV